MFHFFCMEVSPGRLPSQVSQFWYLSVFVLALGTRWTWSVRKSWSSVLRTFPELLSLLPSFLLSVLLLDIEAPGLVIKASFLSCFLWFCLLVLVPGWPPRLYFQSFLWVSGFFLSNFYSHVIFFVLIISPYYSYPVLMTTWGLLPLAYFCSLQISSVCFGLDLYVGVSPDGWWS